MSKKVPQEQYERTLSHKLKTWLEGSKDLYVGNLEMKPQSLPEENEETRQLRQRDQQQMRAHVYDMEHNREMGLFRKLYQIFCVLFCVFLVVMLLIGVADLPPFGNAENPVNNEVSRRYIESSLQETGAENIDFGFFLFFHVYVPLGESHVLFIATCTVLILLRVDQKKGKNGEEEAEVNDRGFEPKNDVILQTAARLLVPFIIIFGIYIILCGHLGPGGGFSGGAVIGAGLILYVSAFGFAKTERFFTAKTYKWMSFGALACYSLSKTYSFYTGANHIESVIPLGTPGAILSSGLILLLNICVGVVVAGTIYTFYVMFRKGGY